tara:strand:- start:1338 stop:1553 length:216 start_codon:yes stop_codon:yes gene_type:complete
MILKSIELAPREKEVLKLLGAELTSKEISEQLFSSVSRLDVHRKILLKTGEKLDRDARLIFKDYKDLKSGV